MQSWEIDLIVPVPLDHIRRKQRGYNQAALLANPLSAGAGIPMSVNALRRVRKTCSQVGLSIEERMRNVHEAFSAADSIVNSQSVLLIDDVVTTGATLNACSVALKKAGAKFVCALTLARSLRLQDASATITKRRYR
jgi:ComF family protein